MAHFWNTVTTFSVDFKVNGNIQRLKLSQCVELDNAAEIDVSTQKGIGHFLCFRL
jgi:hypothetical protein